MKAVHVVEGRAAPLDRSDVDTDQIIPSDWLKRVERTGFGRGLFSEWRDEPAFVLNRPEYQGATILLAGAQFGTGSSREHAVWALMDFGFGAVVASSFGDIFKNNSAQQGLVTVELAASELAELMEIVRSHPSTVVTIDVAATTIEVAEFGWRREFAISPITRERLLNGWDLISVTMQHTNEIDAYEHAHDRVVHSLAGIFDDNGRVVNSNDQVEGR